MLIYAFKEAIAYLMSAKIINGNEIAAEIRNEIRQEVQELKSKHNITPGLVTILVGEDPASMSYVKAKIKTANELGFYEVQETKAANISEGDLLKLINKYNKDPKIHGILVQLPLPKHIDEKKIIYAIDPKKDVDGFHPVSVGNILIGEPTFLPCTPAGIHELITRSGTKTEGAECVVVGRSNIVGKPIAMMLMQKAKNANATVTICHTKTKDLTAHTKRADILIVPAGFPSAITGNMIKPGATVIDVGVNRVGKNEKTGKNILKGDVDFEGALKVAGAITPVPGGVGPMTITMLMKNTLKAAKMGIKRR